MLSTVGGLGISQSAVRDISEANGVGDKKRISTIISVTNYIILFTSLLGLILTILLSPILSKVQFGDSGYTIAFIWLSIVVALNIFTESQLAILKGTRQLKELAKASLYGAIAGLIMAIPLYYLLGERGIIASLIASAFAALFFSNLYVRRVEYTQLRLPISQVFKEATPMIKMGVALMMVTFLGTLFNLIIASYISRSGSISDVGIYNAGATIITGYFAVIITAMTTDYYPRISAVYKNNNSLQNELNKQAEAGLILVFPLTIIFVFLSPFFIRTLYTAEFYSAIYYTDYAILGTIIIIVSNCMDMILLAKQDSKLFITSAVLQRVILIGVYIIFYKYMGLKGLGLSYLILGITHISIMSFILIHFYSIKLSNRIKRLLLLVLITTFSTNYLRGIEVMWLKVVIGILLFVSTSAFTYLYMRRIMGIDLLGIISSKINKRL